MKLSTFFSAVLLSVCLSARASAQINVGDKPTLQFKSATGQNIDLANLKGKLVLVDFWATWCGPCMEELPHLLEVHKKYSGKGLQIIGVTWDEDRSAFDRTVKERGMNWIHYFDPARTDALGDSWGVSGIPRMFLFGPDGALLWTGHPARMDGPIEDAFKNHPPQLVDPKVLASAVEMLDQIEAQIEKKDLPAALKTMAKVPEEAKLDTKFADRQKEIQQKLEAGSAALLAEVDPMITSGDYIGASARLKELVAVLGTSDAGKQARKRLDEVLSNPEAKAQIEKAEKEAKGQEALVVAQRLQAEKKDELAYGRFKEIVKTFAGTSAAELASSAAKAYESDPAFVKRVVNKEIDAKAKAALNMAENYQKAGRTELAKKRYEEVVKEFPNTTYAEKAKAELAKLK
jgi:thiol-disulfide isomerase/thioredoxin